MIAQLSGVPVHELCSLSLAEERAEAVAGHVAWVLSTHFRADVIGEV